MNNWIKEEIEIVDINLVKENPDNPRTISDLKFNQLVQSIKDFPRMLQFRPIVVNSKMVVLGGNMRLKACKEAGLKSVPIIKAEKLSKDNLSFGTWDSVKLMDWDSALYNNWGLDDFEIDTNVNLEEFFEDKNEQLKVDLNKLTFEFNNTDFDLVIEALNKQKDSKEKVLMKLLKI